MLDSKVGSDCNESAKLVVDQAGAIQREKVEPWQFVKKLLE